MSRAAKRCIVVAEKILPTEHFVSQPELTVIPGLFVEAVVHAPAGAWPTSILPLYDIDEPAMRHYIEVRATPAGFARYLDETRAHDHVRLGAAA
jgi:glutaconate CoA-transferase subunit A